MPDRCAIPRCRRPVALTYRHVSDPERSERPVCNEHWNRLAEDEAKLRRLLRMPPVKEAKA